MSFEVNPVLAGTFDAPDYGTANNLAQTTNTNDVSGPDSRRYTQFDRSATEAGSTTNFSFSDLVDMLNPLEHIPVVSSIYRAVTGDTINPVSRVAGDILYGGVFGAASAVFGGVSAVADAGLEEQTGKDSGGLAVAALFGPDHDKKSPVQLADAGAAADTATPTIGLAPSRTQKMELTQTANPTPLLAALAVPTNTPADLPSASPSSSSSTQLSSINPVAPSPSLSDASTPGLSSTSVVPQNFSTLPAIVSSVTPAAAAGTTGDSTPVGGIPFAKASASNKQPFGGISTPTTAEAQNMAVALSEGSSSMRMGHTIYTNKLVNGSHSLPPMLSAGNARLGAPAPIVAPPPVLPTSFAVPTSPSASAGFPSVGQTLAGNTGAASTVSSANLSSPLLQDMMMKAISQYGNLASVRGSTPGATVNVLN